MERLTDLVGPSKEAVANNGPNAQRLQALLATVKTCITKQQFTPAAEGLDMLAELLSQTRTPSLGCPSISPVYGTSGTIPKGSDRRSSTSRSRASPSRCLSRGGIVSARVFIPS